jgi:hypothetical protein
MAVRSGGSARLLACGEKCEEFERRFQGRFEAVSMWEIPEASSGRRHWKGGWEGFVAGETEPARSPAQNLEWPGRCDVMCLFRGLPCSHPSCQPTYLLRGSTHLAGPTNSRVFPRAFPYGMLSARCRPDQARAAVGTGSLTARDEGNQTIHTDLLLGRTFPCIPGW